MALRFGRGILASLGLFVGCAAASSPSGLQQHFGPLQPGASYTIPAGLHLRMDVCSAEIGSLMVSGVLSFDAALAQQCPEVHLRVKTLHVSGPSAAWRVGQPDQPWPGRLRITLGGHIGAPGHGMAEQRQIMVMAGARFDMHGESSRKSSWTTLSASASSGDRWIELSEPTQWQPGDVIVISSTSLDPNQAERRTVLSSMEAGRLVELDAPLQFAHFGRQQAYGGKRIDTRAAVGLLSHDLVIEGDEAGLLDWIGGNVMVMNEHMDRPEGHPASLPRPPYAVASVARFSGVEFRRMGQRGRAGRYALHWHLVDEGSQSFVRNSAFHEGFQRAVVIHGTDGVLVEGNVGYRVSNHMFVPSEDGDEVRNRFIRNLGVLALRVAPEHFAFPRADNPSRSEQSEERIALFWLRNSFNTLRGNRAAGMDQGQGFFLDHGGFNARSQRLAYEASGSPEICDFRDNVAHSLRVGLGSPDLYTPLARGFGLFTTRHNHRYARDPDRFTHCTIRGFQAWKTQNGGIWTENGTRILDAIITDSHIGVVSGDVLDDVVVVGQSENLVDGETWVDVPDTSRGGFVQSNNGGQNVSGRRFNRLTCIGLPSCFYLQGAPDSTTQLAGAFIDAVRLQRTAQGLGDGIHWPDFGSAGPAYWGSFLDVDGALTGTPGARGSLDSPSFMTPRQPIPSRWGWPWPVAVNPSEDLPATFFRDGFE